MKKTNNSSTLDTEANDNFFREIDIQFLIHELKDPISIIETGMQMMLKRRDKWGSLSNRQEKTLKRALRNAKKARTMVYTLLEIGRSQSNCHHCTYFNPVEVVHDVLIEVIEMMAQDIYDRYTSFSSRTEALDYLETCGISLQLESNIDQLQICQDLIRFGQITGNLLKNAFYHRQSRVMVRMWTEGDQLVLEIGDDGPGIALEHRDLIFKRYKQVETCQLVNRHGHGLGLACARLLARSLGGNIEIVSDTGQGAVFRLTLPLMF